MNVSVLKSYTSTCAALSTCSEPYFTNIRRKKSGYLVSFEFGVLSVRRKEKRVAVSDNAIREGLTRIAMARYCSSDESVIAVGLTTILSINLFIFCNIEMAPVSKLVPELKRSNT